MGNESEFFGWAATLRGWTHPINRRLPWLKYLLAVTSILGFAVVMRLASDWSWVVVIGWVVFGIIWFQVFSRWRDFWWGRKRGSSRANDLLVSLAAIVLILLGAFTWPIWMAFGEDMFD